MKKRTVGRRVKIRRGEPGDAAAVAVLATQLGYPTTRAQAFQRLRRLSNSSRDAVFVTENRNEKVTGWVHVSMNDLLETGLRAEIHGLIVGEESRNEGTGARLLRAAEKWAWAQGCDQVNLRSNVIRKRAHKFYLRQGYEHYKTQKAFRKKL